MLLQNFEEQIRCTVGDVQVAYCAQYELEMRNKWKKNVITVIRCRLSKGLTSFSSLLFFPSHGARETLETRRFMIIPKQVYDVKLDDNDVDRCAFVKLNWVVYITNINKRLVIRQPSHGAKEWERTLGTRSSHTLCVMFYMEWFKLCFLSGENRICTMSMSAFEV